MISLTRRDFLKGGWSLLSTLRIHRRLNLLSLMFSAMVALFIIAGGGAIHYRLHQEHGASHARLAAAELAGKAGQLLRMGLSLTDFLAFDEVCEGTTANNPLLLSAAVYDTQCRLLYGSEAGYGVPPELPCGEVTRTLQEGKGTMEQVVLHAITGTDNTLFGFAAVSVNRGAILRNTLRSVFRLAAAGILMLAGVLIIQNRLFRRIVEEPLAELVRTADSIGSLSMAQIASLRAKKGPDDIGRVYGALEQLLSRIFEARAELLKQNENLESVVRMRTEQLEESNALLAKDIERRKALERELRSMANKDPLTGLLNRRSLDIRLDRLLSEAGIQKQELAVLYIDLDFFKTINDTLGHETGDRLLVLVAGRLRAQVRKSDPVARIGGDEFIIVLPGLPAAPFASRLAEKIILALSETFNIDGNDLGISPSIGISLFPGDGRDPKSLLKNADLAMYMAKSRGRNTYCFFSPETSGEEDRRFPAKRN